MENFIDHISISNFKSIRELKLEGLTRINLFIGKPNVGKSNILEALGIFSLPYLELNPNKKLSSLIRVEHQNELFHNGNLEKQIFLSTNIGKYCITKNPEYIYSPMDYNPNFNVLDVNINNLKSESHLYFDSDLKIVLRKFSPYKRLPREIQTSKWVNIKYYNFLKGTKTKKSHLNYLIPPSGANQMQIIENIPALAKDIRTLFNEYGLNLVFDKSSQEIKITKSPQNGEIFLIPYSSIADTLQRVIFHKTAMASNQNSVLIFEEPEAHAFPPYISHITHEIIDSKSNQYIISTHSPYVLNDFLENAREELSIFMVDYKDGETVTNKITKKEIEEIYQYGIDLFTNYETFLK